MTPDTPPVSDADAPRPEEGRPLRVFASGLGVQSTAALVLSARGEIDFPVHLFSNVGDDSENPGTLRYAREVAFPYAKAHGIELVEIHKVTRSGERQTLLQALERPTRSVGIPVRMANGAPGTRQCTGNFKLRPIRKWLREHGASKESPATVGIGISVDEIERAGRVGDDALQRRVYPLIDLGLRRVDCLDIVADAGLPAPPKSSCYFCPFHRPSVWAEMRRDEPELFEKSAQIEDMLNERRRRLGEHPVWLTRFNRPLREAIGAAQQTMFGDGSPDIDTCDEGVCFV